MNDRAPSAGVRGARAVGRHVVSGDGARAMGAAAAELHGGDAERSTMPSSRVPRRRSPTATRFPLDDMPATPSGCCSSCTRC